MRSCFLFALLAAPGFAADWNPRLAADYLDGRQKAWFAWPQAGKSGAPCLSCHTGMTYMLVRPELRRTLGEKQATEYEVGFSKVLREHASKQAPARGVTQGFGTDSVLGAMVLAVEDAPSGKITAETQQAFERLWAAQQSDGAWPWYNLELDPWEMPESRFFGAAIAALGVGYTPAEYRERPEVQEHVAKLVRFLDRDTEKQPFHNRLMLLWASSKLPEALPAARRKGVIDQARQTQQTDGSWTMTSLGPWQAHPTAPATGPDANRAYATAFTAFALEQAGIKASDPMLRRALDWLRSHQNAQGGYWDGVSMNKKYEDGSMMELFMRDAATGFATMALLNAHEVGVDRSTRP